MDFVAILLKTGQVLEEVVLQIPCSELGGDRVLEMVSQLPKVAQDCRLSWY